MRPELRVICPFPYCVKHIWSQSFLHSLKAGIFHRVERVFIEDRDQGLMIDD